MKTPPDAGQVHSEGNECHLCNAVSLPPSLARPAPPSPAATRPVAPPRAWTSTSFHYVCTAPRKACQSVSVSISLSLPLSLSRARALLTPGRYPSSAHITAAHFLISGQGKEPLGISGMKMAMQLAMQQRAGARPCRGWRAGGRPCIRRRALESGNGSSSSPSSSPSSADVVSLLEKKVAVLGNVSGSDRGPCFRSPRRPTSPDPDLSLSLSVSPLGFGFDAELRKAVTTSVEDLCAGCPAGEAKDATGTWRLVYSTNFGPEANPRGGSR